MLISSKAVTGHYESEDSKESQLGMVGVHPCFSTQEFKASLGHKRPKFKRRKDW